jgi:hypothetical protein
VRGNLLINTRMPLASQSCLHNSGLWISCYRGMCVPWDTKCRDGTFSLLPCIHFTRAIGAPFLRLSGCSCINFGKGCTSELLRLLEAGDYLSHFSLHTCSKRKASKALWQTGPSLSIRNSDGSNGIRAIHTCHEGIELEPQMSQSRWT